MTLLPCPSCQRHVRIDHVHCPFCAATLDPLRRLAPDTSRRMTRAAAFVFGATVAVTACGGDVQTEDDGGSSSSQSSASSASAGGGGGAGGDGGSAHALYGGPAVGGGGNDPGAGGFAAEYGAPPPPED